MKDIKIGIVGGTGGMGKWFARFFEREGYTVHVCGRRSGMPITRMADICQVVIISVPIAVTREVIASVGPYMHKDSLLMDLTSLKSEQVKTMLEASVSEVIGCHPLFGPQVKSIAGRNIVLCPARSERWLPWLLDVLGRNGASVVIASAEKHDRMMALVQAVNHLNTVTLGVVLSKSNVEISELMRYSTPNFQMKIEIIEKVFCRNPRLYAEIITMNPEARDFITLYGEIVRELLNIVEENDTSRMADIIAKHSSSFS